MIWLWFGKRLSVSRLNAWEFGYEDNGVCRTLYLGLIAIDWWHRPQHWA